MSIDILANAQLWEDANCLSTDPDLFFEPGLITSAKAVCSDCPIRTQCADYALKNQLEGVWGGLSDADRKTIRKTINATIKKAN